MSNTADSAMSSNEDDSLEDDEIAGIKILDDSTLYVPPIFFLYSVYLKDKCVTLRNFIEMISKSKFEKKLFSKVLVEQSPLTNEFLNAVSKVDFIDIEELVNFNEWYKINHSDYGSPSINSQRTIELISQLRPLI